MNQCTECRYMTGANDDGRCRKQVLKRSEWQRDRHYLKAEYGRCLLLNPDDNCALFKGRRFAWLWRWLNHR